MKNITQILLSVLVILSFACQAPEAEKKQILQDKKVQKKSKPKKERINRKNLKKTKTPAKGKKQRYIDLLAKELKLNAAKKAGINKINKEFNTQKQKLLKQVKSKKLSQSQLDILNKQRELKLRKFLGDQLYKKKQQFDKKRKQ